MITRSEVERLLPIGCCGDPLASMQVVLGLLRFHNMNHLVLISGSEAVEMVQWWEEKYGGFYWLALYMMNQRGLTEHGSGIRFGWLTKTGEAVLEWLEMYGIDSGEWPEDA